MREHPILFNGEMVRATMERRKTQTRRPMRPQPMVDDGCMLEPNMARSPFGTPGDRLWVRETFAVLSDQTNGLGYSCDLLGHAYAADPFARYGEWDSDFAIDVQDIRWRPSIHMPRAASRTTLTVKRVWAERVQDITEADAAAEGVRPGDTTDGGSCIQLGFVDAWDGIYAAKGLGWDVNPWVWACEFEIDNAKEPDHA